MLLNFLIYFSNLTQIWPLYIDEVCLINTQINHANCNSKTEILTLLILYLHIHFDRQVVDPLDMFQERQYYSMVQLLHLLLLPTSSWTKLWRATLRFWRSLQRNYLRKLISKNFALLTMYKTRTFIVRFDIRRTIDIINGLKYLST